MDIYQNARAILATHRIEATVFVTTDYVMKQQEPWWDELEYLAFWPDQLPRALSLPLSDGNCSWVESALYGQPAGQFPALDTSKWNWYQGVDYTSRQRLFRDLYGLLKLRRIEQREEMMGNLFKWAGLSRPHRSTHRFVSPDELIHLDLERTISIGAHTVHHAVLSMLSAQAQWDEIAESKRRLEEIVGHEIRTFAYPFGAKNDYTPETQDIVLRAGFTVACSSQRGIASIGVDRYSLPRHEVQDCDGASFELHLRDWRLE